MDALAAIAKAKEHIAEMFQAEKISHVGLEEVEFVDASDQWRVTIGFERPWDQPSGVAAASNPRRNRTYKVVTIADQDERILSVKNREPAFSE